MSDEQEEPVASGPVVELEIICEQCGWPLRNLGYKYEHIQPLAPDDHHTPQPVPA